MLYKVISLLQSILEGKTDELPARVCDVRDVARAHIRAIEDPSASGRHIISQPNNIPSQVVVNILKERFPQNSKLHGKDGDSSPIIDNSKVNHHNQCETLQWPHRVCVSFQPAVVTAVQSDIDKHCPCWSLPADVFKQKL